MIYSVDRNKLGMNNVRCVTILSHLRAFNCDNDLLFFTLIINCSSVLMNRIKPVCLGYLDLCSTLYYNHVKRSAFGMYIEKRSRNQTLRKK